MIARVQIRCLDIPPTPIRILGLEQKLYAFSYQRLPVGQSETHQRIDEFSNHVRVTARYCLRQIRFQEFIFLREPAGIDIVDAVVTKGIYQVGNGIDAVVKVDIVIALPRAVWAQRRKPLEYILIASSEPDPVVFRAVSSGQRVV